VAPTGAALDALERSLAGELLLPGSERYERARKPFIARFDEIEPAAVARCAAPEDVAEVVRFARRHGAPLAMRSGGHCLAGHSSTRGILIDVTPMAGVTISQGVVEAGAGVRSGELVARLFDEGSALPTGTCPTVGIAGLALGGGIGILGRKYGLTLDHLLGAEVVLADGRLRRCDEEHDAELFWALRGAGGGNFGVVTSLTFAPREAPRMTSFRVTWPYACASAATAAWQAWAPQGPDELSADLVLSASGDPNAAATVEVYGAAIRTERDTTELLEDLVAHVGCDPTMSVYEELNYLDTCARQAEYSVGYDQMEQTPDGTVRRQGHRYTKSDLFDRPLPIGAAADLARVVAERRVPGQARSVGCAPWGGAYNRRSPRDTAFAHRDALFSIEHMVVVDPTASVAKKRAAQAWVGRSWGSVHSHGSGAVYQCFPDPDLGNWAHAYYGPNRHRLTEVKAHYDPDNVFEFAQSIPGPG
jgi:FAD/FMN-containing dehydrogenase